MTPWPKISILALCYNHARFLDEALGSIENLSYPNLEVWIADDASTDASPEILRAWQRKKPEWNFLLRDQNQGNCKTFNQLLRQSTGEWVLDFATDDRLLPHALEGWVRKAAESTEPGFCYADAWVFQSDPERCFRFSETRRNIPFPEGNILPDLLLHPPICPPAVLFRSEYLKKEGGYDEGLAFEDWDIWLRLARKYPVVRWPEPVIEYRKHPDSLSASLVEKRNRRLLESTLEILNKITNWPELQTETPALERFARYHLRLCFFLQFRETATAFFRVLLQMGMARFSDRFLVFGSGWIPVLPLLYRFIQRFRRRV